MPDAISSHGGGGRGIHWYQTGSEVLGYVPGVRGGYRVPIDAIPRLVQCASISTCVCDDGAAGDSWTLASSSGGSGRISTFRSKKHEVEQC